MHKQNRTNRDIDLENIMESMYTAASLEPLSEGPEETCPKCGKVHPINASCGKVHEADDSGHEPVNRVGDEATGDPREYKIGQILRTAQTGDHLDGMIVNIYEEDGELTFALMEVGEEGWSVKASEIKPAVGADGKPIDPNAPNPSLTDPRSKGAANWPEKW
jgi:hypothetical protein